MATVGAIGIGRSGSSALLRMEIAGFDVVQVKLGRFADGIQDWRRFWREYFLPAFYRQVESNYRGEGSFVGGWAALSPAYAAWKARHAPGRGLLVLTDRLRQSLTWGGDAPGPGGIAVAEKDYLIVGTSVTYAQYHQTGTSRMPRRPVIFPGSQGGSTFGRLLHRFAVDEADKAGLQAASNRATATFGGQFL